VRSNESLKGYFDNKIPEKLLSTLLVKEHYCLSLEVLSIFIPHDPEEHYLRMEHHPQGFAFLTNALVNHTDDNSTKHHSTGSNASTTEIDVNHIRILDILLAFIQPSSLKQCAISSDFRAKMICELIFQHSFLFKLESLLEKEVKYELSSLEISRHSASNNTKFKQTHQKLYNYYQILNLLFTEKISETHIVGSIDDQILEMLLLKTKDFISLICQSLFIVSKFISYQSQQQLDDSQLNNCFQVLTLGAHILLRISTYYQKALVLPKFFAIHENANVESEEKFIIPFQQLLSFGTVVLYQINFLAAYSENILMELLSLMTNIFFLVDNKKQFLKEYSNFMLLISETFLIYPQNDVIGKQVVDIFNYCKHISTFTLPMTEFLCALTVEKLIMQFYSLLVVEKNDEYRVKIMNCFYQLTKLYFQHEIVRFNDAEKGMEWFYNMFLQYADEDNTIWDIILTDLSSKQQPKQHDNHEDRLTISLQFLVLFLSVPMLSEEILSNELQNHLLICLLRSIKQKKIMEIILDKISNKRNEYSSDVLILLFECVSTFLHGNSMHFLSFQKDFHARYQQYVHHPRHAEHWNARVSRRLSDENPRSYLKEEDAMDYKKEFHCLSYLLNKPQGKGTYYLFYSSSNHISVNKFYSIGELEQFTLWNQKILADSFRVVSSMISSKDQKFNLYLLFSFLRILQFILWSSFQNELLQQTFLHFRLNLDFQDLFGVTNEPDTNNSNSNSGSESFNYSISGGDHVKALAEAMRSGKSGESKSGQHSDQVQNEEQMVIMPSITSVLALLPQQLSYIVVLQMTSLLFYEFSSPKYYPWNCLQFVVYFLKRTAKICSASSFTCPILLAVKLKSLQLIKNCLDQRTFRAMSRPESPTGDLNSPYFMSHNNSSYPTGMNNVESYEPTIDTLSSGVDQLKEDNRKNVMKLFYDGIYDHIIHFHSLLDLLWFAYSQNIMLASATSSTPVVKNFNYLKDIHLILYLLDCFCQDSNISVYLFQYPGIIKFLWNILALYQQQQMMLNDTSQKQQLLQQSTTMMLDATTPIASQNLHNDYEDYIKTRNSEEEMVLLNDIFHLFYHYCRKNFHIFEQLHKSSANAHFLCSFTMERFVHLYQKEFPPYSSLSLQLKSDDDRDEEETNYKNSNLKFVLISDELYECLVILNHFLMVFSIPLPFPSLLSKEFVQNLFFGLCVLSMKKTITAYATASSSLQKQMYQEISFITKEIICKILLATTSSSSATNYSDSLLKLFSEININQLKIVIQLHEMLISEEKTVFFGFDAMILQQLGKKLLEMIVVLTDEQEKNNTLHPSNKKPSDVSTPLEYSSKTNEKDVSTGGNSTKDFSPAPAAVSSVSGSKKSVPVIVLDSSSHQGEGGGSEASVKATNIISIPSLLPPASSPPSELSIRKKVFKGVDGISSSRKSPTKPGEVKTPVSNCSTPSISAISSLSTTPVSAVSAAADPTHQHNQHHQPQQHQHHHHHHHHHNHDERKAQQNIHHKKLISARRAVRRRLDTNKFLQSVFAEEGLFSPKNNKQPNIEEIFKELEEREKKEKLEHEEKEKNDKLKRTMSEMMLTKLQDSSTSIPEGFSLQFLIEVIQMNDSMKLIYLKTPHCKKLVKQSLSQLLQAFIMSNYPNNQFLLNLSQVLMILYEMSQVPADSTSSSGAKTFLTLKWKSSSVTSTVSADNSKKENENTSNKNSKNASSSSGKNKANNGDIMSLMALPDNFEEINLSPLMELFFLVIKNSEIANEIILSNDFIFQTLLSYIIFFLAKFSEEVKTKTENEQNMTEVGASQKSASERNHLLIELFYYLIVLLNYNAPLFMKQMANHTTVLEKFVSFLPVLYDNHKQQMKDDFQVLSANSSSKKLKLQTPAPAQPQTSLQQSDVKVQNMFTLVIKFLSMISMTKMSQLLNRLYQSEELFHFIEFYFKDQLNQTPEIHETIMEDTDDDMILTSLIELLFNFSKGKIRMKMIISQYSSLILATLQYFKQSQLLVPPGSPMSSSVTMKSVASPMREMMFIIFRFQENMTKTFLKYDGMGNLSFDSHEIIQLMIDYLFTLISKWKYDEEIIHWIFYLLDLWKSHTFGKEILYEIKYFNLVLHLSIDFLNLYSNLVNHHAHHQQSLPTAPPPQERKGVNTPSDESKSVIPNAGQNTSGKNNMLSNQNQNQPKQEKNQQATASNQQLLTKHLLGLKNCLIMLRLMVYHYWIEEDKMRRKDQKKDQRLSTLRSTSVSQDDHNKGGEKDEDDDDLEFLLDNAVQKRLAAAKSPGSKSTPSHNYTNNTFYLNSICSPRSNSNLSGSSRSFAVTNYNNGGNGSCPIENNQQMFRKLLQLLLSTMTIVTESHITEICDEIIQVLTKHEQMKDIFQTMIQNESQWMIVSV
jgi:hypothetical protein